MSKKLTTEEFIEKAQTIYGGKYDYSKASYINTRTKVCIICNECGTEFWQSPDGHLRTGRKGGCPQCSINSLKARHFLNIEKFIAKAKLVHGNKYDYSKVDYKNSRTKVCIICPEHGEFYQTPANHLSGQGCPECGILSSIKKHELTLDEFVEKSKVVHGDKYNYSKVEYKNNSVKVRIICPEHGEFYQTPTNHLAGHGCSECVGLKKLTTEKFIERAKKIHGNNFDYSKTKYTNTRTKVCIICKECGAEFWQTPLNHLNGRGCPHCKESKGEKAIKNCLTALNVRFIYDSPCLSWLAPQRPDFYLPDYNMIIEYDGEQHFHPVNWFNSMTNEEAEKSFRVVKENDLRKNQLCEQNNVAILRIGYSEFDNINSIITKNLK